MNDQTLKTPKALGGGGYPDLSGPTTKKNFFIVSSKRWYKNKQIVPIIV